MKTAISATVLFTTVMIMHAQESVQISDDLSSTDLGEGMYLISHVFPRFGSNCLFVLLPGQQAVLIDTPNESSGTQALLKWIDSSFGKLELRAIITGWHQDNMGGSEYLRSLDIDVYGPDLTDSLIRERGDELKSLLLESTKDLEDQKYYQSYLELEMVAPNRIFPIEEGLYLELGGEIIEVFYPGESHTADNTVVYLHNRQVLFGGCMIFSKQRQAPGFIEHANMSEWPVSVNRVIQEFPPCKMVIPGHGPPGDMSLLYHTVEVLNRYNSGLSR
jgi:glyoxylase-like metal-dependent hydrolase (beta-lactamase superfamily II)